MNDTLDDLLQRYFDDVAAHDRLGETPTRVIMRRGARRRVRRRTGAMAGTLVVGALGSVVAVNVLSRGDTGPEINTFTDPDGGGGSPVPQTGEPQVVPSPLVWNEVTVGSAEAIMLSGQALPDSSGGFYALSSQPGRSENPTATLYHSDDGLRWAPLGTPPKDISTHSALFASDDRLYAVGTAAAVAPTAGTADPGNVVIATSSDDGASWSNQPLPVDLAPIRALPDVRSVSMGVAAASGPNGMVVAAVTRAQLDTESLTPAGVDPQTLDWNSDPNGVIEQSSSTVPCNATATVPPTFAGGDPLTATTVPMIIVPVAGGDPGTCIQLGPESGRYTWEEMGVSPDTLAASRGQLHMLLSTDGTTFAPTNAPALPAGWQVGPTRVHAVGAEFLMVVDLYRYGEGATSAGSTYEAQTLAFRSPDGSAWTPTSLPLGSIEEVGTLDNGEIVLTGSTPSGPAVAVGTYDAWRTTNISDVIGPDTVIAGFGTLGAPTSLGIAGLVWIADEDPSPPATALPDDPATTASTVTGYGPYLPGSERAAIVFSPDGVTWSVQVLDALGSLYPSSLQLTDEHVIIDATTVPGSADPDAPPRDRTLFVGTLAG